MLKITNTIFIDDDEIDESFIRSSGPGGQNVNKVATKAVLRLSIADSPSFNSAQRELLLAKLGNRMTNSGELVLHASQHRHRERNRTEAIERLVAILRGALTVQKKRRPTKPTRGSKRRRLDNKRKQGDKKRLRRDP